MCRISKKKKKKKKLIVNTKGLQRESEKYQDIPNVYVIIKRIPSFDFTRSVNKLSI